VITTVAHEAACDPRDVDTTDTVLPHPAKWDLDPANTWLASCSTVRERETPPVSIP
jgi:hypothetical protein